MVDTAVGPGRCGGAAHERLQGFPLAARLIIPPGPEMTLRRLFLFAAVIALFAYRRRVLAMMVRVTGTNVQTERATHPA
jgi:hypothetical protein